MNVLLHILVVLIAAKVAAEVAERVGVPAVVGEILAGVLIGPSALGLVGGDAVLRVLGELGVILLLLDVGMQMDLAELGAVGRTAVLVALVGVAVPFGLGYVVTGLLGHGGETPLFVGAALTATSVGITARVFGDLRALASVEARTVLGAAVVDDVLGLVILTVVVRVATGGSVSAASLAGIIALAVGFLALTGMLGVKLAPPLFRRVSTSARSAGTLVALALAFTLGFAELSSLAGLAPIVGAFVAGLALARSDQSGPIRRELTPVGHLFIPVFFLQIGIDVDIAQLIRPPVLGAAAALLAVAVVGKLVSPLGAVGAPGDKRLIGLGMLPRGEVGLIFAGLGLRAGILTGDIYAALLVVVLVTTLITPPLLRWRLGQLRAMSRQATPTTPMPDGGWLEIRAGRVELRGIPGDHLALHLALDAALRTTDAPPGASLLDWLSSVSEAPLRWNPQATRRLFAVLAEGNTRSWRLLEATGVLERALPELAETYRRRRADPNELDPANLLRWSLVERVRQLATGGGEPAVQYRQLAHPEWLALAALMLEAAGEGESPVDVARRLVKRLDLGAEAEQEIALLVGESGLLRGTASRPDALSEEVVLPVALHLERAERARALYLLSLALGDLGPVERIRLDDLARLVLAALAHPELTGRPARNLVERKRSEAARLAGLDSPAAARAATAPLGYLMSQDSAGVAHQVALLDPVPSRHRARVTLSAANAPREWHIEVAARDQKGLFAAVTGVLAAHHLDVIDAVLATWPDGAALESFRVLGPSVMGESMPPDKVRAAETTVPDAASLAADVADAFPVPLGGAALEDALVTFDDDGSPWYTRCRVEAADRPGLLHALAVAFATAGANVHSASAATTGGRAVDRFELTDQRGAKFGDPLQQAIRHAIHEGGSTRRRRRLLRRGPWTRSPGTRAQDRHNVEIFEEPGRN